MVEAFLGRLYAIDRSQVFLALPPMLSRETPLEEVWKGTARTSVL